MKNLIENNKISICIVSSSNLKNVITMIQSVKKIFMNIKYEIIIFCNTEKDEEFIDSDYSIYDYDQKLSEDEIIKIVKEKSNNEWVLLLEEDEIIKEIDESDIIDIINSGRKESYTIEVINNNEIGKLSLPYSLNKVRLFHKDAIETKILNSLIVEKKNYLYEKNEEIRELKFIKKIGDLEEKISMDQEDPYGYFLVALAYKMHGKLENSREYFLKALDLPINPNLGYVQIMVILYGNLLLEMEEYGDALLLENLYEYFEGIADFLCLMGKIYLNAGFVPEAIREFSKALNTFGCIEFGNNTFIPNYYLGCIYEVAGDIEIAKKLYTRCGNYAPAQERLKLLQ